MDKNSLLLLITRVVNQKLWFIRSFLPAWCLCCSYIYLYLYTYMRIMFILPAMYIYLANEKWKGNYGKTHQLNKWMYFLLLPSFVCVVVVVLVMANGHNSDCFCLPVTKICFCSFWMWESEKCLVSKGKMQNC